MTEMTNHVADDFGPVGDAAREIASYCDGPARVNVYKKAKAVIEARLAEVRAVVIEANNSLYGSQGFFLSTNGGPPNKYHLAQPIEELKALSNKRYNALADRDRTIAEQAAEIEKLREAASPALTALEHSLQSWPDVERKLRAALQKDQTDG